MFIILLRTWSPSINQNSNVLDLSHLKLFQAVDDNDLYSQLSTRDKYYYNLASFQAVDDNDLYSQLSTRDKYYYNLASFQAVDDNDLYSQLSTS